MKNKKLFLITLFLFGVKTLVYGQDHAMHDMHMVAPSKNVYLKMMDAMMVDMDKAPKQLTFGKDFLAQMIPHHQGALAMAEYEIAHGKNFKIIQIAKSINAEQKSEIKLMQLWLRSPEAANDKATPTYRKEMDGTMTTMMNTMPDDGKLHDVDQAFELVMIPHHQAAIDMARVVLKYSHNNTIRAYAAQLISNEELEIEQMKGYLK